MSSETIKEFNNLHGYANADTAFVRQLRALELSERQIAGVIILVSTMCLDCFDGPSPCNCERDE